MAIYETIFILDSLIPPKDIETTIQKYSAIITENGGKVREVDKWGKRRLAYEIQKKQYGFYVAIEFEGPGNLPRLLESDYNYNDKVLRFLTYRFDKNKLKALDIEQDKAKIQKVEPATESKEVESRDTVSEIAAEEPVPEGDSVEEAQLASETEEDTGDVVPDIDKAGEEDKS